MRRFLAVYAVLAACALAGCRAAMDPEVSANGHVGLVTDATKGIGPAASAGLDLGHLEFGLDPLGGLFGSDAAPSQPLDTTQAQQVMASLEARLAAEQARGAEADQALLASMTKALEDLKATSAQAAAAKSPEFPGFLPRDWSLGGIITWLIALVAFGIAWLSRRKIKGALDAAVAAGKELLAKYEAQPYVGTGGREEAEARLADAPSRVDALEAKVAALAPKPSG